MTSRSKEIQSNNITKIMHSTTSFLQSHMERYGFEMMDVPIIEQADLFLTKAGDQIAEQLFTFDQHGKTLTLRPEFTASAVHLFINNTQLSQVARWQFSGPIFINTPEKQNQHLSVGAEIFGLSHPLVEAEIINMATHALLGLNITGWELTIGHVDLTRQLLSSYNLDHRTERFILHRRPYLLKQGGKDRLLEELADYIPGSPSLESVELSESGTQGLLDALLNTSRSAMTMGGRTRYDITKRLIQKRHQATQWHNIVNALEFLGRWMAIRNEPAQALPLIEESLDQNPASKSTFTEWKEMIVLLEGHKNTVIQPDLARNWDYYSGTVFEIRTQTGELLVGGGRYDDLPRLLGYQKPFPAIGLAFDVRAIAKHAMNEDRSLPTIHLQFSKDNLQASKRWAEMLREQAISVALVEKLDPDHKNLIIANDGTAIFNGTVYQPRQVSALVQSMKGS